jgi:hypothetical protein
MRLHERIARVLADGIAAGKTKVTAAELVVEEKVEAVEEPAKEPDEIVSAEEPELEPAAVVAEGGESA